jgi:hypothetical protein
MFKFDKVICDSGWKVSFHSRCITDYEREITTSGPLSNEELALIAYDLKNDPKCPGWTGVGFKPNEKTNNVYRFYTTWDSSD